MWGSTYQSNLNRIIILQKKIIRIISKVSFDAHTGVLFKEQEILKFSDIYLYQIGKFMYLFKRGLLPNYFRDMFTLASQIHSYNTRNSSLFYIPLNLIVELIFENYQFRFKVLSFSTHEVGKFKTVEVSVCLAKDLKNPFFFSQIYSLLSYIPFRFLFSFLFLFVSFLYFF